MKIFLYEKMIMIKCEDEDVRDEVMRCVSSVFLVSSNVLMDEELTEGLTDSFDSNMKSEELTEEYTNSFHSKVKSKEYTVMSTVKASTVTYTEELDIYLLQSFKYLIVQILHGKLTHPSHIYLQTSGTKYKLLQPLLIITAYDETVEACKSQFICNIFIVNDIESLRQTILSNVHVFLSSGFLPLSDEVIRSYMSTIPFVSDQPHPFVFHVFETLGYVTRVNGMYYKPSYKMINALMDTQYAAHLIVFENNSTASQLYESPKYINALYELLKLIDINIIETVERLIYS